MNENNFFWLLAALFVFLLGVPLADDLMILSSPVVKSLIFSCFLIIGVWSLKGFGRFFSVGVALVIAGIILNVLAVNLPSAMFLYGSLAALFGFLLITIFCTFKQVVLGTDIECKPACRIRVYLPPSGRHLGGCLQLPWNDLPRIISGILTAGRWGMGQRVALFQLCDYDNIGIRGHFTGFCNSQSACIHTDCLWPILHCHSRRGSRGRVYIAS